MSDAPTTRRQTLFVSSRKSHLAMVQTVEVIGMLEVCVCIALCVYARHVNAAY